MKNGLTELVFILDKSGSMYGLEGDTIGGFNSFIEKQKEAEGEALVSTVLFSNSSKVIHDRVPLSEIADMTRADYSVDGCTALIDAIGDAVHHITNVHKYIREEDVPEHTIFVIITDGMENASHKWKSDDVKKLIEKKRAEDGWQFIFLGANIDAAETAAHIGIDRKMAVDYSCNSEGTRANFDAVGNAVRCVRQSMDLDYFDWSEPIRNARESGN